MFRIAPVDPAGAGEFAAKVTENQTKRWGAPLNPFRWYARRPTIYRAVVGMWGAIDASGLVEGRLKALLNRRVAALNGCEF